MGFNRDLPWYDVFGEIGRKDQAAAFQGWLASSGPNHIVTDSKPSSISAFAYPRGNQIRDHVEGSGAYQIVEEGPDWMIWRRKVAN